MNFGSAGKGFFSVLARRLATALFFCVMFLLFVVTCHPISSTSHFELSGTSTECCQHVIENTKEGHSSPLSQITLPGEFKLVSAAFVTLFAIVSTVVFLSISPAAIRLRRQHLAWLWAKPWPFAWGGGYLPSFSSARDS